MILPGLPWFKLSSAFLEEYGRTGSVYCTPSAEKDVVEEQEDKES